MKRYINIVFNQRFALALLAGLMIGFSMVIFLSGNAFAEQGDDFNDNSKDETKWGTDGVKGQGRLSEANERLEYSCGSKSGVSSSDRPWKLRRFPSDSDWSIEITATNTTSPSSMHGQWSSFGINVESMKDKEDSIEVELAAFSTTWAELYNNGQSINYAMQVVAPSTTNPISISFNSLSKVFTVSYYDGASWVDFGTFGVNGSGGFNGNANWGLTDSDQFIAYVFGYSEKMTVDNNQLYGDDFTEAGGIVPPPLEIISPIDGTIFDTCSYFAPPLFQWSLPDTFQKLELQFYTSANQAKPTKVKVKDPEATQLQIPSNTWKKILKLPGLSGGDVNFKIVGTNKGQPIVESDVYTMTIAAPEPVDSPIINPTSKTGLLPTLTWGNACGTKFKAYFSPDNTFSRKKKLSFTDKIPTDNGESFKATLTNGTWNAIRKLVNDTAASTIYWYVESWDVIKRYQRTDDMEFVLKP